ncbi:recombination and DNA strand exchange inhibitor protein (plasmid) [Bacillus thuringiensis serovar tolworthi]|uniref:Recombination and DNA strand exchange inhibitor protein n=2 Tax=Bacillus cereus group TaxID=86661 RepID=A0A9W4A402_BACTO|nr:DUF3967 domain-containing protein [Bacillus thuringiensis]MEB8714285.1 DUF3967 domain-containing protein [Bacillus cereus]MDR5046526.1 DUF3967 domain-containing protein [Bacillus thuringiensis]MEB8859207.1 DUF3967 domain-containing protein [Bacillus cereus]MEB9435435.1 DUF3967 domain-containing protein [Bacillus cereus]MEB9481667.1 DUF3967 domain-containing protein [Bacillus cereus]
MDTEQRNGIRDSLEKSYWTKEVAETLGISDSYLRKWCLELEKNGYKFIKVKDGKNRENRAFTEHDLLALRKFQSLIGNSGTTRSTAAKVIAEEYSLEDRNGGTGIVPAPLIRDNDREKALEELKKLAFNDWKDELKAELREEIKQELKEEIQQHMKEAVQSAEERLGERLNSHDELLMKTIREQQETKKLLAAAKEKKPWWRFW